MIHKPHKKYVYIKNDSLITVRWSSGLQCYLIETGERLRSDGIPTFSIMRHKEYLNDAIKLGEL